MINYFFFVAEEVREYMAKLGYRTMSEMTGQMQMLDRDRVIEHWKAKGLDFTNLLYSPEVDPDWGRYCQDEQDHGLDKSLDLTVLLDHA